MSDTAEKDGAGGGDARGGWHVLTLEMTPRLSTLPGLFKLVETFGEENGVPEANVYLINLTLDELLTNYVRHSVRKVAEPKMDVRLRSVEGKVILKVVDSGPPFDPRTVAPFVAPAGEAEVPVGGVGLHLVRSYADRMEYSCVGECNHLTIEHELKAVS